MTYSMICNLFHIFYYEIIRSSKWKNTDGYLLAILFVWMEHFREYSWSKG